MTHASSIIPISDSVLGIDEEKNILDCIRTGWIAKGKYIDMFEESFAKYIGTKYAVSCTSGTAALHLALLSSGIKKDDEVIMPTMTFAATAFVVNYCNARPVFVDVHPDHWCIDTDKIIEAITPNTKAIIAVDLFGHPSDYDALSRIVEEYNLILICDSCESLGAEYKGNVHKGKTGSFGISSCFSFFGNKIITCGEGGMLTTDNRDIADKAIYYRNNCTLYPYYHTNIGYNYRLDNMRASIGYAQLQKIDKFVEIKKNITKIYKSILKDNPNIKFQKEEDWSISNYWMTSISLSYRFYHSNDGSIDNIRAKLKERGIETRPFFTPMHILPPYRSSLSYPISEMLFKTGISLPSGCSLTEKEVRYVANTLNDLTK